MGKNFTSIRADNKDWFWDRHRHIYRNTKDLSDAITKDELELKLFQQYVSVVENICNKSEKQDEPPDLSGLFEDEEFVKSIIDIIESPNDSNEQVEFEDDSYGIEDKHDELFDQEECENDFESESYENGEFEDEIEDEFYDESDDFDDHDNSESEFVDYSEDESFDSSDVFSDYDFDYSDYDFE